MSRGRRRRTGIEAHHNEWLSLVEVSGPFLSMPVLKEHLPQGLKNPPHLEIAQLRAVYGEWEEAERDPAIHDAWIRYVLEDVLQLPPRCLARGQELPPGLAVRLDNHGETLTPDLAMVSENGQRQPRLLVAVHHPAQDLEGPLRSRGWSASPATRMMELLRATGVRLGLVTNGERWILVHAPPGETTCFASWYAELWCEEPITLKAFWELLSVGRWFGPSEESLETLLAKSADHQQEVTDQLGSQVRRAVELLVWALDREDKNRGRKLLEGVSEPALFEAALTVMMRLIFLMAAEERRLLPVDNPIFAAHYAVSPLAAMLREAADRHTEEVLERRHDAWSRLLASFRTIHAGLQHEDLHLPAYGGSLFDPDRFPFLEGRPPGTGWQSAEAHPVPLDNKVVLYCLESLQLLKVGTGDLREARRVSFRALDVEQIGHVYEGLLDHTVKRAQDLVVSLDGAGGQEPELPVSRLETAWSEGFNRFAALLKSESGRAPKSIQKALEYEPKEEDQRLLQVCDHDDDHYGRVRPFAGLIRRDPFDNPVVVTPGSVYVTQGTDRRTTGTHYTPRSLTEEIVRHTLDPLVYEGMDRGLEPTPETLKSPEALLDLKVCDLAMGSGAFLVQACRYLAEKLVEAWDRRAAANPGTLLVRPFGRPGVGEPGEQSLPSEPGERVLHAKRAVAQRCLYGVDKDHRAVEMAKLSLWLETMAKDRPFTFVDHALRCGDSLLGVTSAEQVEAFSLRPDRSQGVLFGEVAQEALKRASLARQRLESFPVEDERDAREKAALLREAQQATEDVRLVADLLVGATLASYAGEGDQETLRFAAAEMARKALEHPEARAPARRRAEEMLGLGKPEAAALRWPLHWVVEFPEVFRGERSGFDAIVGNPPFLGGLKLETVFGANWRAYLVDQLAGGVRGVRGTADLCAYFFLRAARLVRDGGRYAFLATNTIAQGDTREVGLDQLVANGIMIPRAVPSRKWPGSANLEVAEVWLHRGTWSGSYRLEGREVPRITPFLTVPGRVIGKPYRLAANAGKSFQGSNVLGLGFVLKPDEAQALIDRDSRNREVLFPYLILTGTT